MFLHHLLLGSIFKGKKKNPKIIRCLFRKALLFIPSVLSTPGSGETSASRRGTTSKGDECQESQRRSRKETPSTWGLISFWGSVCSLGTSFAPLRGNDKIVLGISALLEWFVFNSLKYSVLY